MNRKAAGSRGSAWKWTLAWAAVFLCQFTLGRSAPDRRELIFAVAALQTLTLAMPLVGLSRGWGGPRLPQWERTRIVWMISRLVALVLGMNHLHAVRALSAAWVPSWLYVLGHWTGTLLSAIGVPLIALVVLSLWIAARARTSWQILDVLAVGYGSTALLLLCILNGGRHPFDRFVPELGEAWQRLTCYFLPVALFVAAASLWVWSSRRRTTASV
jgi:hypothetical protein